MALNVVLGALLLCLTPETVSSGAARAAGPQIDAKSYAEAATTKIAPQVLADTIDGASTSVVIWLADQVDVSLAYSMPDQNARGWFVYNTLTQHAARTQAGLQKLLDSRGVTYQSYWAANMLVATADRSLIELLAARSDVGRIDSNTSARWIEEPALANDAPAISAPSVVE